MSNDSREEKTRTAEINETLRAMLAAAGRDKSIELSVIGENNLVLPLRLDSATLALSNGARPDTSQTTISVKTRIPAQVANTSALVAKLRDFAKGIKPAGRTEINENGDFVISIVNPQQYRDKVIELFAADVKGDRRARIGLQGDHARHRPAHRVGARRHARCGYLRAVSLRRAAIDGDVVPANRRLTGRLGNLIPRSRQFVHHRVLCHRDPAAVALAAFLAT